MTCIGCHGKLEEGGVVAYAIMHERDIEETKYKGELTKGPGKFHGAPVCGPCYGDPTHRKVQLKAHFALPNTRSLFVALGTAGSTDIG